MSSENSFKEKKWDVIIAPRSKVVDLNLRSVWRYRDLIWMFFKRDFIAFYKQTILGPLWYLIQPILTAFTYFVIFGKIANISTDGLPPFVFYISGIVVWTYFSACLTNNAEVFSKNAQLFGKVYFPRLVVPISVAISGMVAFAIQFALLLVVSIGFIITGTELQFYWQALPMVLLLVLYVACLGIGVGLVVSALTVRFRDLAFATGFVTQLWMFASPVVYPFSQIPERYRVFFHFNPMTAPIESLRALMFGTEGVGVTIWLSNLSITLVLLILGLVLFTRAESNAMDTV
ncbi:TagG ABC-type polysaccharide/polyol phosphate export systems, permease component [Burkholderiaceae bacterium]